MHGSIGGGTDQAAVTPLATPGAHVARFYRYDEALVGTIDRLVRDGLAAGDAVVTITTRAHHAAIAERQRASRNHADVAAARDDGRYLTLDAGEVLDRILVHGRLVARRFEDVIGEVLDRARARSASGKVRALSEAVALLCEQNRYDLALHLEEFWSDLLGVREISVLCAYPLACFDAAHRRSRLLAICGWHSHVGTGDGEPDGLPHDVMRAIAAHGPVTASADPGEGEFGVTCRWCAQPLFVATRIAEPETAVVLEHLRALHPDAVPPIGTPKLGAVLREVTVDKRR